MHLGIDASNLRQGGTQTHLAELLSAATPNLDGFEKITVWCGTATASLLPHRLWLAIITPRALDGNLLRRTSWQLYQLPSVATAERVDILFTPGGNRCRFSPYVSMSRNMLPFQRKESRRFGSSWCRLRLSILRHIQTTSFRNADGMIYLTNYAKKTIERTINAPQRSSTVIPHGVHVRFRARPQHRLTLNAQQPTKLCYVSTINLYKHQWNVVRAVGLLRQSDMPLELHLAGPSYGPASRKLNQVLDELDPRRAWVIQHGKVPYSRIHSLYEESHIGVFASSCENMPNILLEMMAAALPIACSRHPPMPEILRDGGTYFNPESPSSIAQAILALCRSRELRERLSARNFQNSQGYSWEKCARDTFRFINETRLISR